MYTVCECMYVGLATVWQHGLCRVFHGETAMFQTTIP